jgi:hypothetical protein
MEGWREKKGVLGWLPGLVAYCVVQGVHDAGCSLC